MPRMKPEKYLAWAKKRAIKLARKGRILESGMLIGNDLVSHPTLQDHPGLDKTYDLINSLFDGQSIDADEFVQHLKKDY